MAQFNWKKLYPYGFQLNRRRWWLEIGTIALLYTLFCWLVLKRLPILEATYGSPVWPGAGITVGGLLAWGRRRWFGVFLGAAIVNFLVKDDPAWAATIGTLAVTVGVVLTVSAMNQWIGKAHPFERVRNVVLFTLCSLFSGTLIQSLVGVTLIFITEQLPREQFLGFLANWWIGDSIGVLVIAPVFFTWCAPAKKFDSIRYSLLTPKRPQEFVIILASLGAIGLGAFGLSQPVDYLLFPPLLWCAFRFSAQLTTLLVAIVATSAAICTAYKLGTFYRVFQESESLLLFQLFIGVMAVTVLVVLGIVAENERAQQQLNQLNSELEQRVLDRTSALQASEARAQELATKAEAANQAKSAFIANMSHELRSPLNAVLGFSQLMLRSRELPPDQYENAGIIYRSGDYLLTLINNILDLSKLEANKATLNPHSFDLVRLLEDLEDMLHLRASSAGLDLIFEWSDDLPRYIYTDEMKLRQILINLLSNGIKFTSAGRVWLTVDHQPTNDPETWQLNIVVGDTGLGIGAKELEHLFDPFTQGQAGREKQEGTGLGLSISRKFIQLMGGEIQVESTLGQGTRFSFHIPVQIGTGTLIDSDSGKQQVKALAAGQPTYRILVVDDKDVNRQLMIKLLTPLGFEVQEAANGREAIARWEEWDPHLIWMDMRMPVMDGYEATKFIKSTTKGMATAVIALTASVLEEERAVILSAGCDDFLRKPFAEHTIFDALTKHLGVTYIYEDSSTPAPQMEAQTLESSEQLAGLPQDWLNSFFEAALEANGQAATDLVDAIPPSHQHLQASLKTLTRQFQFETLVNLVEPLMS
ncbi:MASE1 domain-containing protein [Candidatus Synechococcus calcipolaris G9]|uniref:histidine kinase n=1 Tax=Candidatus Synechococcus calcipolaris G9 TaxID=1497997 RepID=A0ABT6EUA2_9SYNE|nr:MASE1 domain-containing protein [Candidatus Synechococcus calcipolaris]MDG2989462.1 MASE1 domain-containing protein [Candidatus Synechococcus calcipolaris G9]